MNYGALSVESALWLIENIKNPVVKVEPRGRGGHCTYGRARLIAVNEKAETAIIQPFGHKRTEEIELTYLRKWYRSDDYTEMPGGTPKKVSDPLSVPLLDVAKFEVPEITEPKKEEAEVKKQNRKWTDKEFKEIYELENMGKNNVEIAVIMGTTAPNIWALKQKRYPEWKKRLLNAALSPTPVELPQTVAPIHTVSKVVGYPEKVISNEQQFFKALRDIIGLRIPDSSKLLAIESLLSGV